MSRIRLDKYLSINGLGTRSEVKKLLKTGTVTVNGVVQKSPEYKIDDGADTVAWDGQVLSWEPTVWLMLHKPSGCVTAAEDQRWPTVMDYISHPRKKELFPVGRLDRDTEGLLLLTNDGAAAHRLLSPAHHVDKTYFVRVEGSVDQEDAAAFLQGLSIGEKRDTLPAMLKLLKTGPVSECELTIQEGKFHQVKRMFEARGKQVIYLKRIAMAGITLDETLPPGEWRPLTDAEKEALYAPNPHASHETEGRRTAQADTGI